MNKASSIRKMIRAFIEKLLIVSLQTANRQRGESDLKKKLIRLVPDITHQYSTFSIPSQNQYLVENVRCQHAFQMSLTMKAIGLISKVEGEPIQIVDIGDSAGTHVLYLEGLARDAGFHIEALSVNLDPESIKKIESKGLKAVQCRAEELHRLGVHPDLFLSYEMLEHLFDPIGFLHTIAENTTCEYFLITVPYVYRSRIGLHQIRAGHNGPIYAENTHIFELCPEDWDLLFAFSGWDVLLRDRYTQYPGNGLLRLTKALWRKVDFDGFYGVVLKKNLEKSKQYKDWPT